MKEHKKTNSFFTSTEVAFADCPHSLILLKTVTREARLTLEAQHCYLIHWQEQKESFHLTNLFTETGQRYFSIIAMDHFIKVTMLLLCNTKTPNSILEAPEL
jgi:hypothetical protein